MFNKINFESEILRNKENICPYLFYLIWLPAFILHIDIYKPYCFVVGFLDSLR